MLTVVAHLTPSIAGSSSTAGLRESFGIYAGSGGGPLLTNRPPSDTMNDNIPKGEEGKKTWLSRSENRWLVRTGAWASGV